MSPTNVYAERIAALEVKVDKLEETVESMNVKLDALLALKHKGTGAFVLASTLFGTSIVGTVLAIIEWFKG